MLYQVVSRWAWWDSFTYEYTGKHANNLAPGTRVRIPLGSSTRIGFVLSRLESRESAGLPDSVKLRAIESVLDERPVLPPDIWNLALWMSRAFFCSVGTALWSICPEKFLAGAPVVKTNNASFNAGFYNANAHRERTCFDPRDDVRLDFYRELCLGLGQARTLVLFSSEIAAKKFFKLLPSELRETGDIIFWPSAKVRKRGATQWDAWQAALNGQTRVIVGGPAAVFAPLHADRIIVEDEACPAYKLQFPDCHARSLAGYRSILLGSELVLGGRMPSARTFVRVKPVCKLPSGVDLKKNLVLADLKRSVKINERGIEGDLPVTISLLKRTREVLASGRNVLWLLDRRGGALEVFCPRCGHAIRCPKCGGLMRAVKSGQSLKCYQCGHPELLPERCPECKGQIWLGKRPGLESLKHGAERLLRNQKIFLCEGRLSPGMIKEISSYPASLILGTRGALPLCDILDIALVGWLDLDSELYRPEYDARFNVFHRVWDSLWRGQLRTVVLQCRNAGVMWREGLEGMDRGWGRFWRSEIAARSELELPPLGAMIEIKLTCEDERGPFIENLESAGLFVMDPGEPDQPLWIPTRTIAPVANALAPRFGFNHVRKGYPRVTVHSE